MLRPADDDLASPWHAGEVQMQHDAGVADRMSVVGPRVIRRHLIDQHRAFFTELPFIVLGAVDGDGDAWATLRAGMPGFLHAPDPSRLRIAAARDPADPADGGMNDGDAIGLLGIQPETRRRNRLNGVVRRAGDDGFEVVVRESFGNCPRFIWPRRLEFTRDPATPASQTREESSRLQGEAAEMVRCADTFFVASYIDDGSRRVDVSHRGGRPGFIRLEADGALSIPDYAGNLFFNTLGNFIVNPRAGLVVVDWERGDLLQMTGHVEMSAGWTQGESAETGAERIWRFIPTRVVRRREALPLRMRPPRS